jgi:ankyrin repeat protein
LLSDGGPNYQRIIKLLLDHGAAPSIKDKEGRTPLNIAREKNLREIISFLEGN